MKDYAEAQVSDEEFADCAKKYAVDTPDTKEAYFIRKIYESRHCKLDFACGSSDTRSPLSYTSRCRYRRQVVHNSLLFIRLNYVQVDSAH